MPRVKGANKVDLSTYTNLGRFHWLDALSKPWISGTGIRNKGIQIEMRSEDGYVHSQIAHSPNLNEPGTITEIVFDLSFVFTIFLTNFLEPLGYARAGILSEDFINKFMPKFQLWYGKEGVRSEREKIATDAQRMFEEYGKSRNKPYEFFYEMLGGKELDDKLAQSVELDTAVEEQPKATNSNGKKEKVTA